MTIKKIVDIYIRGTFMQLCTLLAWRSYSDAEVTFKTIVGTFEVSSK